MRQQMMSRGMLDMQPQCPFSPWPGWSAVRQTSNNHTDTQTPQQHQSVTAAQTQNWEMRGFTLLSKEPIHRKNLCCLWPSKWLSEIPKVT